MVPLLLPAMFIFLYMSCLWAIAQSEHNNSIADSGWSLGFLVVAVSSTALDWCAQALFFALFFCVLVLLFSRKFRYASWIVSFGMIFLACAALFILYWYSLSARAFLVCLLVYIWAVRIFYHIFKRSRDKDEDPRYVAFRKAWGEHQMFYAFIYVFMLQGFLMLIVAYPLALVQSVPPVSLGLIDIVSIALWAFGMLWEAVGDYQLATFLKDPANKGRIMKKGLWHYTRHPNYFGESVMWWAIFFLVLPVHFGWTAIISPITITLLLRFVSGVPLAEKSLLNNPEFQEYMQRTPAMIPWIPKK